MPIDDVELAELFMQTVGRPEIDRRRLGEANGYGSSAESYFLEPDHVLEVSSVTLAELTTGGLSLLERLASDWQQCGSAPPAEMLRDVAAVLQNRDSDFEPDKSDFHRRLLDFVYPVV